MICPRCGRSTPGNVCPYCDGPQIDDHTDDYKRRKMEYENLSDSDDSDNEADDAGSPKAGFAKIIIPLAIAAAAAVAAMIIISTVRNYRPAPVYDDDVFYASEGRYYRANGADSLEVGDAKTVFFNGDGSRFFISRAVEDFLSDGNYMIDRTMSDNEGRIFACSLHDSSSDNNNYRLFVWEKDHEPREIISSDAVIGIRYISDSGRIFFTKTDILTEELGTGSTSLWCCDYDTDKAERLEINIDSVSFYLKNDTIIIRKDEDELYTRRITDPSERNRIADGVSELLLEEKGCNNCFRINDSIINSADDADRLCYRKDSRLYMYELPSENTFDIGSARGSDIAVCYDDINRLVYIAEGQNISCGISDGGSLKDRNIIDSDCKGTGILWNDYRKTLLYLSSDGMLKRITDRQSTGVSEDKGISNLIAVENDGGYAMVKDNTFYYGSAFDREASPISEISFGTITKALKASGYIYRMEGQTCVAATDDGTYTKDMGKCERLWYGRQ